VKGNLEREFDDVLRRIEAGETLEQCLAGYAPEIAGELRSMAHLASAFQILRDVPPPSEERVAAHRRRFMEQAATLRQEMSPAPVSVGWAQRTWQQATAWLLSLTWKEAMLAASLTLVFGLLLLLGTMYRTDWMRGVNVPLSMTSVAS